MLTSLPQQFVDVRPLAADAREVGECRLQHVDPCAVDERHPRDPAQIFLVHTPFSRAPSPVPTGARRVGLSNRVGAASEGAH